MLKRVLVTLAGITSAISMSASAPQAPAVNRGGGRSAARLVRWAEKHDVSRRLRDIPPVPPALTRDPDEREPKSRHVGRGPQGYAVDTVVQDFPALSDPSAPTQSFEGVGNVNGVLPPDTNGDVGPSHYVQWVNLSFAIYAKGAPGTTPTLIYGPAAGNTLWAGFGGPCESTNNGDPIVVYDHLADRWVMSQLALPNAYFGLLFGPFYECIAVSATGDPTGAYYRYQFQFDKLNDYPKLGVWPDAYYMAMNEFTAITLGFAGQGVVAFDRASMLNGQPALMIYMDLASVDLNLGGMLPADLDGPPPPAGTPGYFVQMDDDAFGYSGDQLQLWQFHADWTNPAASTFTRAAVLPTQPFDSDMCNYSRTCIPQPGTTAKVDALADRLMYRLQYRNFGDHESLVANHTVDVDGNDHAGIRWYEIRDLHAAPFIYQQGTYAPDADHRWMASAAMDGAGDLALGFSVSGTNTPPSIRYTGRLASDPPGILTQAETTLVAGSGVQTHASGRWGDYSMLTVDPTDDCTFWYTQEYYAATSESGWHTRIGAFSFPSCQPSGGVRVTATASATPASEAGPVLGAFTLTRSGDTSQPLTVDYAVTGSATPDVDYVVLPGSVTIPTGAASATVTVTPIDDTLFEGPETVVLTVSLSSAYRLGAPASAVVTILSDEQPPDLIVSAATAPATGGADAYLTVNDTTRNQGTGIAGASVTGFYLSTNTTFDSGDVLLGTRPVPSLAPGGVSSASTALRIPANTTAGTYYILAKADSNDAVPENVETNNVMATAAVSIGPDLLLTVFNGPSSGGAGGTMIVSATTANQGGGAAPSSSTKFYLSQNSFLDSSDPLIGSRTVPSLAPGAIDAASVTLTVPADTVSGQYFVIGKADADGVVSETQEANNVKLGPWVKIGPDLTVPSLTSPSIAGAGGTLAVTDTTSNQGGGTAPASTTSFVLSTNLTFDASDVPLGGRAVPSLAAGASSTGTTSVQIPAGTASGSYYVLAKADGNDAIAESVETNNVSFATIVRIGPDLTVTSVTAPAATAAGATITVNDTTANQGAGASPGSTTTFYLSTNLTFDATDVAIGQRAVPELAGGATNTASTSVQIPANTATATYFLLGKADGPETVTESNESNNVSFGAVVRVGPDLTASGLSATPSGANILITDTTSNPGGGSAPASTTTFYLSTNLTLEPVDVLLGSRAVPALAAGTSNTASTTVPVPAGTATGSYYVLAKADGPDSVVETVETNNVSFGALVRIGPDLTASVTAQANGGAGAPLAVTDTTSNQGNGAAPTSTTNFYLSTNLWLDAGDVLLGSRTVPPLDAGTSSTATTSVVIPAGTATGSYYVLAKADGPDAITESVETNNVSFGAIVRVGPDLVVTAFNVPISASVGGTFTLTDTTTNQGGGPAGASSTRYYLSTNLVFDAADILIGSRTVGPLGPGASDSASTVVTIPTSAPAGTYYVIAVADGDGTVVESNETNNTRLTFMRIM